MLHIKPNPANIPGFFEPKIDFSLTTRPYLNENSFQVIENLLNNEDVEKLISLFESAPVKEAVSIQGLKDVPSDKGSERTTMWSEELASMLTNLLKFRDFDFGYATDVYSRTDAWQHLDEGEHEWECIGFSPLLRFMSYENGGQHYAHYDAGFIYPDTNYRTLKSVVIYLTTNSSGSTRLIGDEQNDIKQFDRNNLDYSEKTDWGKVFFTNKPKKGNALIFDHRICHDVDVFEPHKEGEKRMIIRGDLIYKLIK